VELGKGQVTVLAEDNSGAGLSGVVGGRAGVGGASNGEVEVNTSVDVAEEGAVAGDGLTRPDEDEAEDDLGEDVEDSVDDDLLVNSGNEATLRDTPGDGVTDVENEGAEADNVVELANLGVDLVGRAAEGEDEGNGDGDTAEEAEGEEGPGGVEAGGKGSGVEGTDGEDGGEGDPDELNPVGTGEEAEDPHGDGGNKDPGSVADPLESTGGTVGSGGAVTEGHDEVSKSSDGVDDGDQVVGQAGLGLNIPDVREEEEDQRGEDGERETDPESGGRVDRRLGGGVVGGGADDARHLVYLWFS